MTKVILDIPSDKIHPFLQAVVKLGIKDNTVQSKVNTAPPKIFPIHFSKFLLFDWEFFSNELEFE